MKSKADIARVWLSGIPICICLYASVIGLGPDGFIGWELRIKFFVVGLLMALSTLPLSLFHAKPVRIVILLLSPMYLYIAIYLAITLGIEPIEASLPLLLPMATLGLMCAFLACLSLWQSSGGKREATPNQSIQPTADGGG